jgi:hypothetical protein
MDLFHGVVEFISSPSCFPFNSVVQEVALELGFPKITEGSPLKDLFLFNTHCLDLVVASIIHYKGQWLRNGMADLLLEPFHENQVIDILVVIGGL